MTRLILTHVGTSALHCDALKKETRLDLEMLHDNLVNNKDYTCDRCAQTACAHDKQRCQDDLVAGLTTRWQRSDEQTCRQDSPAEIASLSLLGVQPGDHLVLISSDTPDGCFCTNLLAHALQQPIPSRDNRYPFYDTASGAVTLETVRVAGLTVSGEDPFLQEMITGEKDVFIREGVVHYVEQVWRCFTTLLQQPPPQADRSSQEVGNHQLLFNITGGYKGIIPIARDLALLLAAYYRQRQQTLSVQQPHTPIASLQSEVCYLYQASQALVRYPALPVRFDWRYIANIQEMLRQAATKCLPVDLPTMDEDIFFEAVPELEAASDRPKGKQLSALGQVVWALAQRIDYGSIQISAPNLT